jgi:hypothetical protein
MITAKLDFACVLCKNRQSWYIMPMKQKTISKDTIRSMTKFELVCKKCKQSYMLTLKIKTT